MTTDSSFSPVAVIPAHLASVRFPRKILYEIHGLPMIEHVRRRALMSPSLDRVVVATCDEEVASVVCGFGGEVVMTSNTHRNGTSRVAEASEHFDCSHVILLQGDEPLLFPRHIDSIIEAMRHEPNTAAWNATGSLQNPDELDRHSFVKCSVTQTDRILFCFRRSPFFTSFNHQKSFVRKILGIIAYRKDFLTCLVNLNPVLIEEHEYIEQMRIIEYGYHLCSVPVMPSLPSVNQPDEVNIVLETLQDNPEQSLILQEVLSAS